MDLSYWLIASFDWYDLIPSILTYNIKLLTGRLMRSVLFSKNAHGDNLIYNLYFQTLKFFSLVIMIIMMALTLLLLFYEIAVFRLVTVNLMIEVLAWLFLVLVHSERNSTYRCCSSESWHIYYLQSKSLGIDTRLNSRGKIPNLNSNLKKQGSGRTPTKELEKSSLKNQKSHFRQ